MVRADFCWYLLISDKFSQSRSFDCGFFVLGVIIRLTNVFFCAINGAGECTVWNRLLPVVAFYCCIEYVSCKEGFFFT